MLSEKQKKKLRSLGHSLKPFILIGDKGITDSLVTECDQTLTHHELIKVRARGREKSVRALIFNTLCEKTGATLIQQVGATALIFRPHPKQPKIDLGRT